FDGAKSPNPFALIKPFRISRPEVLDHFLNNISRFTYNAQRYTPAMFSMRIGLRYTDRFQPKGFLMASPAVAYARQHQQRFLSELKDLLRIPSVSTAPEH